MACPGRSTASPPRTGRAEPPQRIADQLAADSPAPGVRVDVERPDLPDGRARVRVATGPERDPAAHDAVENAHGDRRHPLGDPLPDAGAEPGGIGHEARWNHAAVALLPRAHADDDDLVDVLQLGGANDDARAGGRLVFSSRAGGRHAVAMPASWNLRPIASASALRPLIGRTITVSSLDLAVAVEPQQVEAVELAVAHARLKISVGDAVALELLGVAEVLEHLHRALGQDRRDDRLALVGLEHDRAAEDDVVGQRLGERLGVLGLDRAL